MQLYCSSNRSATGSAGNAAGAVRPQRGSAGGRGAYCRSTSVVNILVTFQFTPAVFLVGKRLRRLKDYCITAVAPPTKHTAHNIHTILWRQNLFLYSSETLFHEVLYREPSVLSTTPHFLKTAVKRSDLAVTLRAQCEPFSRRLFATFLHVLQETA